MINPKVFYSFGGGDEQTTPKETVECIIPYISHLKGKTAWCPFDKADSQFVKVLSENGFNVIYSHIEDGKDFLKYHPELAYDFILSNPPYKNKRLFWQRCLELDKPFGLLMPVNTLSDSLINSTMKNRSNELQLLIPSRRTCFYKDGIIRKSPSFKAIYYCVNLLLQQIILADMKKQLGDEE